MIDSTAFGKFNTTKIPNNKELVVPIFHRSQTLYIYIFGMQTLSFDEGAFHIARLMSISHGKR